MDFFRIFLNFYKFNSIYFELNSLKNSILSRAAVTADVAQAKRSVITWRRMNAPRD